MCSGIGDYRYWWTCRQNRREGIDIEEEQASHGLVDLQTE
jgi:hypothetical protein